MEGLLILLNREHRRRRHQLSHFFDALSLYLEAGFDMGYAWPEVYRALSPHLCPSLQRALPLSEGQSVSSLLEALGRDYPQVDHRLWFQVLRELYERGAGMREAVEAVARTLREEHERDLESHCQRLPTRANVVLLLFFLPPTLLLLFAPLLTEILRAF